MIPPPNDFEKTEQTAEMREINERLLIAAIRHQELAETATQAQNRLHDLVHSLDAVICEVEVLNGKPTFLSLRALSFLGYPMEHWFAEPDFLLEISHITERDRVSSLITSAINCTNYEYEFRALSDDIKPVWMRNIVHPVYDGVGKVTLLRCVIVDVTLQRQAAVALEASYQRERQIAENLQRSRLFMPPEDSFPGLSVNRCYQSASDEALVGGDFWDTFACDHGNVALILGDVMGHGLPAAVYTAELKYVLRGFVREHEHPARVIKQMNDYLCESQRLYREGLNAEGEDSPLCVIVAIVHTATGETTVAAAGMNCPLLVRSDGCMETINVGGLLLGIQPGEDYEEVKFCLNKDDVLILTTDGITEASNGGNFLGLNGLKRLAGNGWPLGSLDILGRTIVEGTREFCGGQLRDDACVLLASVND